VVSILICLFAVALHAQQTAPSGQQQVSGASVQLDGEPLWYIQVPFKNQSSEQRANNSFQRLLALVKDYDVSADDLKIVDTEVSTDIVAGQHIVALFLDVDAVAAGKNRMALAEEALPRIKHAILQYRRTHSKEQLLLGIGYTVLATIAFVAAIWLVTRILGKLIFYSAARLGMEESKLRVFATGVIRTLRFLAIAVLLYFYLQFSLASFPWTRVLSLRLLGYILDPLRTILSATVNELPNVLFLCVLIFVFYSLLKCLRAFFYLIETGRITFSGFYPEWARPTYRILRAVVIGFALVVAFPYVPGSSTEAFKGISIFAGVLLSLGSTSAISNVIAGMILTYMRPYKKGDWIMIGDRMGVVVEMTFLVTRLDTPKNEEISISNAIVLGEQITNYSNMARRNGLIVHTSVTIGYSAAWRKVHELLISAAVATNGIRSNPAPFVLQTALNDFYVTYEMNAYTDVPARSNQAQDLQFLYSGLHQNIQDKFNEAGVEIMSPHYMQLRDGNEPAVPTEYVPRDHIPGALRVFVDGIKKKDA